MAMLRIFIVINVVVKCCKPVRLHFLPFFFEVQRYAKTMGWQGYFAINIKV
jgi:hypothetical protein